MPRFILAFALLFASVPAFAAESFNITDIVRASDADLDAGITDAAAHGDTFAAACYQGIKDYNAAHPKQTLAIAKPLGAVSAFQSARDVVKGVQNPGDFIPKEIVASCGALALDVQGDLGRAATTVGGGFLGLKL